MSINLTVAVIGNDCGGSERVLATLSTSSFDDSVLESLIERALRDALRATGEQDEHAIARWAPEVSSRLSGEGIRPAFHLSASLLCRLAACGASLDFDPYV